MKAFSIAKSTVVAGIGVINLIVAALAYSIVIPFFVDQAQANILYLAILVFLAGTIASFALLLGISLLLKPDKILLDVGDAVRQPIMLLDENNRYLLINRECEKVLGISREKNLGSVADARVLAAISSGSATSPDTLSIQSIFEHNGGHYQVFDNPIPREGSISGRKRVVILREVGHILRLREAVREINRTMVILNANTMKIASSAISLSQGATEQATTLSSITSSMDEFSKKIQGNSETAEKGTQLAAQAREAAERSGGEISHALSAMTDVQDAGIRIARIVKLIDDIAFQTNLLALNAAVEAARAGRQGKGFAVVADEVRNLAGRSAKAAKDTAGMVEDVTERIGNASAYISKLEAMLGNIVQDAIRIADSSAVASATSAEQASGILKVNQELLQMNSVTHTTMSAAEQTATAVEVLSRQVNTLKKKLDDLSDSFALNDSRTTDTPPRDNSRNSINLVDDPATLTHGNDRIRSYLTGGGFNDAEPQAAADDEDSSTFAAPFRDLAANDNPDWDLDAEREGSFSQLSSLLQKDGYEQRYRSFLNSGKDDPSGFDTPPDSGGFVPDVETPDGDRVVKPSQSIQLDDTEFGRY